jgi:hypothetical protein
LPFFVHWDDLGEHPSVGGKGVKLTALEIAGDPHRVTDWIGHPADRLLDDLDVDWRPNGQPGLVSAVFETPTGTVRL